jgi:hypothetical protein
LPYQAHKQTVVGTPFSKVAFINPRENIDATLQGKLFRDRCADGKAKPKVFLYDVVFDTRINLKIGKKVNMHLSLKLKMFIWMT